MELARPSLGLHRQGGDIVAYGGGEIRYLNRACSKRFGRGFEADAALVIVVDVDAVDVEAAVTRTLKRASGGKVRSAHGEHRAHRVSSSRIDVQLRIGGYSRREIGNGGEVTSVQGQILELLRGDVGVHADFVGLKTTLPPPTQLLTV